MKLLNLFDKDDCINLCIGISKPNQEAVLKRNKEIERLNQMLIASGRHVAINGKYPKRHSQ